MIEPTVTISVSEYDALRKIKEAINSKDGTYIRYEEYSTHWVTTDKTLWIIQLTDKCNELKQANEKLQVELYDLKNPTVSANSLYKIFKRTRQ